MVFRGLEGRASYADFGVSTILCEGRHVLGYCRRRFPELPRVLVPVCIDHDRFQFQQQKRLQIAFAPRKRPMEAAFIQDLFRAENPEWRTIPWIQMSDIPESKVAQVLGDSAVYLSLSRFESVGLSILEAFASGCASAGFTGFGAREFVTDANGFWAAEDDCLDAATQLVRAVQLVTDGGQPYSDLLESAHLSARYYSRQRLAKRIVEFWQGFLEGDGTSDSAGDQ